MNWKNNPYFVLREEFIVKIIDVSPVTVMTQVDIPDPKYHLHRYKDLNLNSAYFGGEKILVVSDKCDPIYKSSLIPYLWRSFDTVELRIYMSDTNKIKEFSNLKVRYGI